MEKCVSSPIEWQALATFHGITAWRHSKQASRVACRSPELSVPSRYQPRCLRPSSVPQLLARIDLHPHHAAADRDQGHRQQWGRPAL